MILKEEKNCQGKVAEYMLNNTCGIELLIKKQFSKV